MFITKGHISRPNINDFPKPEIVRGEIIRVATRSIDGALLLTVRDDYGNLYEEVQMIVNTPSSGDTKIKIAVHEGMDVVLLKTSLTDPVYVIGSIYNDPNSNVSRTVEASTNGQDRVATSNGDYRIDNGGNTFNMTLGYGFVFDTNNGFKFQMPSDGVFRISAGTNADDIAVNHGELTDFLCNKAEGYLSQMNDKLRKLEEIQEKTENLFGNLQTLITSLLTFAITEVGVTSPSVPVLNVMNPGFVALQGALNTLQTEYATKYNELGTKHSDYSNLELKTKSEAIVSMINSGNPQVRLPKN
jgi:hypothetical protein